MTHLCPSQERSNLSARRVKRNLPNLLRRETHGGEDVTCVVGALFPAPSPVQGTKEEINTFFIECVTLPGNMEGRAYSPEGQAGPASKE